MHKGIECFSIGALSIGKLQKHGCWNHGSFYKSTSNENRFYCNDIVAKKILLLKKFQYFFDKPDNLYKFPKIIKE